MSYEQSSALWCLESEPTAAAIDHVRLSYCYLDDGDVDGYCSLFTEQVVLCQPGADPVRGRAELERVARNCRFAKPVRHQIFEVFSFSSGRRVAAVGRLTHPPGVEVDFIDVFTVSDCGLLSSKTTFLFTPPASQAS